MIMEFYNEKYNEEELKQNEMFLEELEALCEKYNVEISGHYDEDARYWGNEEVQIRLSNNNHHKRIEEEKTEEKRLLEIEKQKEREKAERKYGHGYDNSKELAKAMKEVPNKYDLNIISLFELLIKMGMTRLTLDLPINLYSPENSLYEIEVTKKALEFANNYLDTNPTMC